MSNNKNTVVRIGPSFPSLLGIVFIILKLTGHITWPWIWVLSPFWLGIALFIFLLGFAALFVILAHLFSK